MEKFEFLFNTDTALYLTFFCGMVIGWFITACMNGIDAIYRYIEERKIDKKIKKLEHIEKEVKENESRNNR